MYTDVHLLTGCLRRLFQKANGKWYSERTGMPVVQNASDVFAWAKTRRQQMYLEGTFADEVYAPYICKR